MSCLYFATVGKFLIGEEKKYVGVGVELCRCLEDGPRQPSWTEALKEIDQWPVLVRRGRADQTNHRMLRHGCPRLVGAQRRSASVPGNAKTHRDGLEYGFMG